MAKTAITLKKGDDIYSSDDEHLGQVYHLFNRTKGVDPLLELYGSYMYIFSFATGANYYVPVNFIGERDANSGRVTLSIPMKRVMEETWFRMPDFIAQENFEKEELPEA